MLQKKQQKTAAFNFGTNIIYDTRDIMYSTENAAAPLIAAYSICGAKGFVKSAAAIRNSNALSFSKLIAL